jgi:hypothetical protein
LVYGSAGIGDSAKGFQEHLRRLITKRANAEGGSFSMPGMRKLSQRFQPTPDQKSKLPRFNAAMITHQDAKLKTIRTSKSLGKFTCQNVVRTWFFTQPSEVMLLVMCTWARADIGMLNDNTFMLADGSMSPTGFAHDCMMAHVVCLMGLISTTSQYDQRLDFMPGVCMRIPSCSAVCSLYYSQPTTALHDAPPPYER